MRKILTFLLIFNGFWGFAQEDISVEYANSITVNDLKTHLAVLASDALGGRETGEAGQKMASAYIGHFFKSNGLEAIVHTSEGPSFLQKFELESIKPGDSWIKINDKTYRNFEDIVYSGQHSYTAPINSKLIFVGSGTEKDYDALEVQNKNILIYCKGNRIERKQKVELAFENGAAHVFIMQDTPDENFANTLNQYKRYMSHGRLTFPPTEEADPGYFWLPLSIGAEILDTKTEKIIEAVEKSNNGNYKDILKLTSQEIIFYAHQEMEKVSTENVLGFIEGTDLKDEYLIITAHYDHLGTNNGEVYNGADDDGSGTVAVMEIAQAFINAKKAGHGPRRSVLFMTVTGEEKGLLGSTYYVNNPVLPLEKTITNLNIDMIGRVDEAHETTQDYVYLIGSDKLSKGLHNLSESINSTYSKLELDYKYNDENDPNRYYYRSDHYNFAKNNIPVIFYFNGTHADYHKPTDTIDKIEFELFEKRARLIFHTAWEIANRDERISVDVLPNQLELKDSN